MTSFRKRDATMLLFLGALAILFFLPVLSGRRTFPAGDFSSLYLPYNIFFRNELAIFHLPIWNPYAYSGHPFLADPQAVVFYPINDLFTLISLPWKGLAGRLYWLQLEAIFHFLLAGCFTFLFVRELTKDQMAGLMAGTTFMFSGYLTGYPALQLTILRTAIWLPLLLWLLLRAIGGAGGWRWWLFFALAYAAAYLGGHPQTFIYLSYVTLFWGVFLAAGSIRRARSRWNDAKRLVCRGGAAGLLFLGLIAAQLLPGVEFARMSVRANVDYDFLSAGATTQDFWQFLLPSVWSPLSPFYVGVIAVGLAGLAAFGALITLFALSDADEGRRRLAAVSLFFIIVGLIALLVGMGRNGPLYPLFYHFAPGWKLFRNQERAAYLVAFSLSALAGLGVAWLPLLSARRRDWFARLAAGVLLAGVVAFFLVWRIPLRLALADRWFATTMLLTLTSIIILARVIGRQPQRLWILLALSLISLFYANWGTLQADVPLAEAANYAAPVLDLKTASDAQITPGRIYNETHIESGFGPALALEDVWGASPLRLQRYDSLFHDFPLDRLWQLTGVTHVLTWRSEMFEPAELLARYQQEDETLYLYHLTDPNPRAWFVKDVEEMADEAAVQSIAAYAIDLTEQAALTPENAAQLPPSIAASAGSLVQVRRLASDHLQLSIEPGPGGLLILSENWMPSWQATLIQDGGGNARQESLTVVRADVTFLGVSIPDGGGVVDVRYQPASVRTGLIISSLTLALLLLLFIFAIGISGAVFHR